MIGARLQPLIATDPEKAILPTQVYGDLLTPEAWSTIDQAMSVSRIKKFDIVTMRPVGSWSHIRFIASFKDEGPLSYIADQVLQRLSLNGEFYFSIDTPVDFRTLLQHLERLNQTRYQRRLSITCAEEPGPAVSCRMRFRKK